MHTEYDAATVTAALAAHGYQRPRTRTYLVIRASVRATVALIVCMSTLTAGYGAGLVVNALLSR